MGKNYGYDRKPGKGKTATNTDAFVQLLTGNPNIKTMCGVLGLEFTDEDTGEHLSTEDIVNYNTKTSKNKTMNKNRTKQAANRSKGKGGKTVTKTGSNKAAKGNGRRASTRTRKHSDSDKVFMAGMVLFQPREDAPDFVVCEGRLTVKELVDMVKERPELLIDSDYGKQLKFTVKESKEGKLYAEVSTYHLQEPESIEEEEEEEGEVEVDDLPF